MCKKPGRPTERQNPGAMQREPYQVAVVKSKFHYKYWWRTEEVGDKPRASTEHVLQKSLELIWCLQQESDQAQGLGHFVDLHLLLLWAVLEEDGFKVPFRQFLAREMYASEMLQMMRIIFASTSY